MINTIPHNLHFRHFDLCNGLDTWKLLSCTTLGHEIVMCDVLKQKDTVEIIVLDVDKSNFLVHNDWWHSALFFCLQY